MAFPKFEKPKDPDEVLDYVGDWSELMEGDAIIASEWIVPTGITKDSESFTTTHTTVWLSGGTAGETYNLLNRIETQGGRHMDRTTRLQVKVK